MMTEHVDEVNRDWPKNDGRRADQAVPGPAQGARPDDGEMTRTQKVRRSLHCERYAPLIDALYDGSKSRRSRPK
jgi:long-chain acyl-CoA synthetase